MKKFNTQICTNKEQSERLLALGLKKETADMELAFCDSFRDGVLILADEPDEEGDFPAWSLHRLVSMIEEDFQSNGRFFCLSMFGFDKSDNLYGNIIDAIEWLIKEGYFNKAYLV